MDFSWKGELSAQRDTRNRAASKDKKACYYSLSRAFALGTPSLTVPQTPRCSKVIPLQSQMCCLETDLECNPTKTSTSYSTKSKHSFCCMSPLAEVYYICKKLNERFSCFQTSCPAFAALYAQGETFKKDIAKMVQYFP